MSKAGNKFRIGEEIRSILLATPGITALVGNKILPLFAQKDTSGDFIFYQRDGYFVERSKMGVARQACEIDIVAVSDDYDRSLSLAEMIFEALEGDFSNPDMQIRLVDATEQGVPGKYMQLLVFSIK